MILVTGGLGMIGAHTACALADLGHEVVVTAYHRTEVLANPRHRLRAGLRHRRGGRRLCRLARRPPPLKEYTHA